MAEPFAKKMKPDYSFFYEFKKKNQGKLSELAVVCDMIHRGHNGMNAILLKIVDANARCDEDFSNARCMTSWCPRPLLDSGVSLPKSGYPVVYSIGSFFQDGVATLQHFMNDRMKLPCKESAREALKKLLTFLSTSFTIPGREDLKSQKEDECNWAVLLAQHLFSKLTVGGTFTIDKQYSTDNLKTSGDSYVCPCENAEALDGDFGDTSFGCPGAWHGSADIMLKNLPILIASGNGGDQTRKRRPSDNGDSSDSDNESLEEVNTGEEFSKTDLNQMLAQSIVFSFLQRKQNKDSQEVTGTLIPSIGVNSDKIIVHLYDSENDILVQSPELYLFRLDNTLDLRTVVLLWMVLNYDVFCSGVKEEIKRYKANFFECVEDFLSKYRTEVTRPIVEKNRNEDPKLNWAYDHEAIHFDALDSVRTAFFHPEER